jgi:general secretion pathway protein H
MTSRDRSAGFTLFELLAVMVVMGLMMTLIIARGPARSRTLDARAAAAELASSFREARSQAIGSDQPTVVSFDLKGHTYRIGQQRPRSLPPRLTLTLLTTDGSTPRGANPGFRFDPDGSSTGGRITLADGATKLEVGIDWLNGRVRVVNVR